MSLSLAVLKNCGALRVVRPSLFAALTNSSRPAWQTWLERHVLSRTVNANDVVVGDVVYSVFQHSFDLFFVIWVHFVANVVVAASPVSITKITHLSRATVFRKYVCST